MRTIPNVTLKMAIFKKGLTQRDVAIATKIDESRISRIIRGYEVPTYEVKREIAKFLGMEERELF